MNISAKPSRKLAALGYSRSSHSACFSIRTMPSVGRQSKACPQVRFHLVFQLLGQITHHVLDLVVRQRWTGLVAPNAASMVARSAFEPSITNKCFRSNFTPR